MKKIWTILLTIVITAVVVGGGVFLWQKSTGNTKVYSNGMITFNYQKGFHIYDGSFSPEALNILISEEPIANPPEGGTTAPISISNLEGLDDELDGLETKTETAITVDGINARRIEGTYANVYNKDEKRKIILVIIENKSIVIRGIETPRMRTINFDLKTVFNQIVASIKILS